VCVCLRSVFASLRWESAADSLVVCRVWRLLGVPYVCASWLLIFFGYYFRGSALSEGLGLKSCLLTASSTATQSYGHKVGQGKLGPMSVK
jgi:hypothetical protein